MKNAIVCFIGLVFVVSVSAESLLEGRVRLESGEPVADAQVRLFDMSDLRQGAIARAQTDGRGYFALPLAALGGRALPARFALGSNYPNPFNPSTIIPYQLAASAAVRLEVFNLLGQRIATLVDGERAAGFHTATWTATDAAGRAVGAGVYIYRMTVGAASQTGRMVLIDGQAGVAAASGWPSAALGGDPNRGVEVYGLIVSGEGLVPYVDSAFRVEAGMAPVELVVSEGQHPAGKATDDGLGGLFDAFNEQQEDAPVTIPDAKLRAAVTAALGKARGATITGAEMKTLTFLNKWNSGIRDLKGLESATNLKILSIGGNAISDVSPLRNLTNLKILNLGENNISDVSPLRNLTNLKILGLDWNAISDVSPLRNLTNLKNLNLRFNFLNIPSINDHIPALKRSGVAVTFGPLHFREGPFDIELVFLDDHFPERQKRRVRYAARRWMSIIREDLPDYTLTQGGEGRCGDHSYEITSGERIDDLRIYIVGFDDYDSAPGGWASPHMLRETSLLPISGCMALNNRFTDPVYFLDTALHEIGHVLGFGTIWDDLGFLQNPSQNNPNADTHFNGPLAIAAFDAAGGSSHTGGKVPVRNDGNPRSADSHWRFSVFGDELMAAGTGVSSVSEAHYKSNYALSAITIQSLADLGYVVDVTQADPYTLPSAAAKASAKIAAPSTHTHGEQREPMYVVDPQGRIVRTISP